MHTICGGLAVQQFDHVRRLGNRVVANWERSKTKGQGGLCYEVTYALIRKASLQVGDARPLPAFSTRNPFCQLFGGLMAARGFDNLHDTFRGRGGAGAMFGDGRASRMLETDEIFAGGLEPGAIIQTYKTFSEYVGVLNGTAPPKNHGHSIIFHRYVLDRGKIVGMKVIDNGYHGGDTVKRGAWGYWVGANIRCAGSGAAPGGLSVD